VRVHACAREGAHSGAREKVTLGHTRRGGGVAIKEAGERNGLARRASPRGLAARAPCSPQMRQLREREREHAEE
jgi:hypothetical protein